MEEWNWTIGQVVAPFGIQGEMKVRLETDFPERFSRIKRVLLRPPTGEPAVVDVERSRLHKAQVLLKVKGVDSIDDVEPWRGAWVQVQRRAAVPLSQGSYYSVDLVGLRVITVDGRDLGQVEGVLRYPAQDLLQVGDVLIPAIKEFVREVDVPGGRIVVDPPAGLLPGEEPENAD